MPNKTRFYNPGGNAGNQGGRGRPNPRNNTNANPIGVYANAQWIPYELAYLFPQFQNRINRREGGGFIPMGLIDGHLLQQVRDYITSGVMPQQQQQPIPAAQPQAPHGGGMPALGGLPQQPAAAPVTQQPQAQPVAPQQDGQAARRARWLDAMNEYITRNNLRGTPVERQLTRPEALDMFINQYGPNPDPASIGRIAQTLQRNAQPPVGQPAQQPAVVSVAQPQAQPTVPQSAGIPALGGLPQQPAAAPVNPQAQPTEPVVGAPQPAQAQGNARQDVINALVRREGRRIYNNETPQEYADRIRPGIGMGWKQFTSGVRNELLKQWTDLPSDLRGPITADEIAIAEQQPLVKERVAAQMQRAGLTQPQPTQQPFNPMDPMRGRPYIPGQPNPQVPQIEEIAQRIFNENPLKPGETEEQRVNRLQPLIGTEIDRLYGQQPTTGGTKTWKEKLLENVRKAEQERGGTANQPAAAPMEPTAPVEGQPNAPWTPEQNQGNFIWQFMDLNPRKPNESTANYVKRLNQIIKDRPDLIDVLKSAGHPGTLSADDIDKMDHAIRTNTGLPPLASIQPQINPQAQETSGASGKEEANAPVPGTQPAMTPAERRINILSHLQNVRPKNMAEYNAMVNALTPEEREIALSWGKGKNAGEGGVPPIGNPVRFRDERRTHQAREDGRFWEATGYLATPAEQQWANDTTPEGLADKKKIIDDLKNEKDIEKKKKMKQGLREFFLGKQEEFQEFPIGSPEQRALIKETVQAARGILKKLAPTQTAPAPAPKNLTLPERLAKAVDDLRGARKPGEAEPVLSGQPFEVPQVPAPIQIPPMQAPVQPGQPQGPQAFRKADGSLGAYNPQTGQEMYVGTGANNQPVAIDPQTGNQLPLNMGQPQVPGQGQQFYGIPGMAAYQAPIGQPQQLAQPSGLPTSAYPIGNIPLPGQAPLYQPGAQGFTLPGTQPQGNVGGFFEGARNVLGNVGQVAQGTGGAIGAGGDILNRLGQLGPMLNAAEGPAAKAQAFTNWLGTVGQGLQQGTQPVQQAAQGVSNLINNPTGGPGGAGGGAGGPYGPLPVWGVPMPYAENQYLRQFYEQTVPTLAERFTALGGGAQRSSAFRGALGQAGGNLAMDLAAQRERYNQQQQAQQLAQQQYQQQLAEQQRQYNLNFQAQQQQQQFGNQLANQAQQANLFSGLSTLGQQPMSETLHRPSTEAPFASLLGGLGKATVAGVGALTGVPGAMQGMFPQKP